MRGHRGALVAIATALLAVAAGDKVSDWEKERISHGLDQFHKADLNADGFMSWHEFRKHMSKNVPDYATDPKVKEETDLGLEKEWKRYDQTEDNQLQIEEWQEVILWHVARKKDEIIAQNSFNKCDRDQDGSLTKDEFVTYFRAQDYEVGELNEMFKIGDKDTDLKLNFTEFKEARSAYQRAAELVKTIKEEQEKEAEMLDNPVEDAVKTFTAADKNKNGKLAPYEFIQLVKSQVSTVDAKGKKAEIPDEQIIATFKKYDINRDISISLEEWTAMINETVTEAHAIHDFDEADLNHDGILSIDEYSKLFEAFAQVFGVEELDPDLPRQMHEKHDLDKDGRLTKNEYAMSVKALRERAEKEYEQKFNEEHAQNLKDIPEPPKPKSEL